MLKRHIKTHMESNQLVCSTCNKKFVESYTYEQHLLTHRERNIVEEVEPAETRPEAEPEPEPEHELKLKTNSDLTTFLDDAPASPLAFQCSECSQSFGVQEDLELHKATHTTNGEYVCIQCNKQFASRSLKNKKY